MASSSLPSRSGGGQRFVPLKLQDVRHEQRRVAALLRSSGQLEVSLPPHNGIPLEDLFKSKFYRQIQAARSLPNTRVSPIGHSLNIGHLAENENRHRRKGQNGAVSSRLRKTKGGPKVRGQALASYSVDDVGLLPDASKHLSEDSLLNGFSGSLLDDADSRTRACQRKSFSKLESLPGLEQRTGIGSRANEPSIDYRLPMRPSRNRAGLDRPSPRRSQDIAPESMTPPYLRYNIGDGESPGNFNPLQFSSFSPTGWKGEGSSAAESLRVKMHSDASRSRKQKSKDNRNQYEKSNTESSPASSSESSRGNASLTNAEDESAMMPAAMDTDGRSSERNNLSATRHERKDNVDTMSNSAGELASSSSQSLSVDEFPPGDESTHSKRRLRSQNHTNDDPYGRAYRKALSVARSKQFRPDSLFLGQRITRPFTFSYFCQEEICQCGNCPPKTKKKKKGKRDRKVTGSKAIFGDVNVYDYFKWPNDEHESK